MKQYRYNLDRTQAKYVNSLKSGECTVIVVPLKQILDHKLCGGCRITRNDTLTNINAVCNHEGRFEYIPPYPVGARVGLRETWDVSYDDDGNKIYLYKNSPREGIAWDLIRKTRGIIERISRSIQWRSAQCMPVKAIRYWGTVEATMVDKLVEITANPDLIWSMGFKYEDNPETADSGAFVKWFNARYAPKFTWEQNPYCQIMKMRME